MRKRSTIIGPRLVVAMTTDVNCYAPFYPASVEQGTKITFFCIEMLKHFFEAIFVLIIALFLCNDIVNA